MSSDHDLCGRPVEEHTLSPDGKAVCPNSKIQADVLRFSSPQVGSLIDDDELRTMNDALFGQPGTTPPERLAPEPPIYAAVRAGDGKWYPTGRAKQGVDWQTLVDACRDRLVGPITVMGPIRQLFL